LVLVVALPPFLDPVLSVAAFFFEWGPAVLCYFFGQGRRSLFCSQADVQHELIYEADQYLQPK